MGVVEAKNGIVGRQDGAATVAEDRIHTFVSENLHDHIGATHARARKGMLRCCSGRGLIFHSNASRYVSARFLASVY